MEAAADLWQEVFGLTWASSRSGGGASGRAASPVAQEAQRAGQQLAQLLVQVTAADLTAALTAQLDTLVSANNPITPHWNGAASQACTGDAGLWQLSCSRDCL